MFTKSSHGTFVAIPSPSYIRKTILLTSEQMDTRQDSQRLISYSNMNKTIVTALWFFLLVSCSTLNLSHIHSLNKPNDLNKYVCDPDHPLLPNTQLLLSPNVNHILSSTSFCLVSNISNITLRSTSITPAIITCRHYNNSYESVGFGFYNVSGLMIENVHITKCGGPMPSTSTLYPNDTTFYFHESQSVTLLLSYSSYIMLFGVNINTYYGFAILIININNNITLNNVNITSSSQCSDKVVPSCGGSGLILYFSNFDNRIGLLDTHVFVNNTVIAGNFNIVPYTDIKIAAQVHAKEPKAISAFAAGMTVIFSVGNYNANVQLSHGYWIGDNGGVFDGLAIIFSDAPVGNTSATITNSSFNHNLIHGDFEIVRIGCLVTTTFNDEGTLTPWDILTISHSLFTDSYFDTYRKNDFSSYLTANPYNHSIIHIITSSSASVNLSVHLDHLEYAQVYIGIRNPFILSESKGHKNLKIILESLYLYNTYSSTSLITALNSGKLVFVNTKSVYINGERNLYEEITGSVIQAYNSDIHLNGTLIFNNNKASHGAAIRLDSLSHLFIHESTNASFINNHVSFYGGAIYSHVDRNLPTINPLCAIQVVSQNIFQLNYTLFFKNNTATLAGNSIYMSPLYDCQQLYLKEVNSNVIYQKLFHFEAKSNNHGFAEISSVPVSTSQCNINNISNNNDRIKVYPGETIIIGLQAYDINGNPTYAQIFTRLTTVGKYWDRNYLHKFSEDITYLLPVAQQIQTVYSNSCTSLHFTIFSQSTSDIMFLHFEVLGYIPTTKVELISKTCPLGFIYSSETKACVCSLFLKMLKITQCNINTSAINIPPQSWLGIVDNGSIIAYTEHCPSAYCLPNTTINITQPDIMCKENRMGWLCGQCKEGYSIVLGSTDCYRCSNTLHTALAISFGILGGIVYVFVLFSLRLTIDLGTLGGFIFWLNIIWPYTIPSSEVGINYTPLQYMVYLLTSIKYQWNIPVCVTSDLNELGKTAILYFFPLYFWLIVVAIVILSRCSTRLANLIVGSSVQVLATLMYISYSDFLSISLVVLTPAYIHFNSTNSSGKLLVWYRDGSVLYAQNPYHIILLCVSIAALSFFIIPFTLVGLFGVKMLRIACISKYFRPFIDAIHGPYKDNLRYWFGLRLIVLSLIYIITAIFQGSNMTLQLLLITFVLGFYTIAQAFVLPYKNKILNILELWFMVLLLVNFIINLPYSVSDYHTSTNIVTTLEIVLCFVTYCIILLYHGYISMSRLRCIRKCVQYYKITNCILYKRIKKLLKNNHNIEVLEPLLRDEDSFEYEE